MIFAFVEDGTLEICEDEAEVRRQYEGIDVESEVVHFYDEMGVYLEPRFTTPNQTRKLFGVFGVVVSGTYELVPNSSAQQDSFALALYETRTLAPNRWFATIEDLKSVLSKQGVTVDFSHVEPKL